MQTKSPKLAAVIVTFNRLEKLKKAIAAVLEEPIDYVVVLNNKSNDGTEAWLNEVSNSDERLHVVNHHENTGGAGGFYFGTKYAIENTDADWLVLFDDDAYPAPGLVEKFKSRDYSSEVGALSAKVCTPDGLIADFNRPGLNPFKSLTGFIKYIFSKDSNYLSYSQMESDSGLEVDYSSFVGFFVKTSVVKNGLGYPRKEFFIYCDDWVYSLDLSQLGYKNLYYSDLLFYHDSKTFIDSYDAQIWKKYYAYRNSIIFYKKAAGVFAPLVIGLKILKWLVDSRLYSKKKEYFETLNRALKDGFSLQC